MSLEACLDESLEPSRRFCRIVVDNLRIQWEYNGWSRLSVVLTYAELFIFVAVVYVLYTFCFTTWFSDYIALLPSGSNINWIANAGCLICLMFYALGCFLIRQFDKIADKEREKNIKKFGWL